MNKPAGMTSHDVVAHVRRALNPQGTPKPDRAKVGHAGTLDPFATGVLFVTVGKATRLEPWLHELDKEYEETVALGRSTDTDDIEGETLEEADVPNLPSASDLEKDLVETFVGTIQQLPPAYAAIKIDGKKMYELAREGKEVKREPRTVTISELEVLNVDENSGELRIRVTCGTGTYIRSLGRDIGERLGTKAHLSALKRSRIGSVHAEDSVDLESLKTREDVANALKTIPDILPNMPVVDVSNEEAEDLRQGRPLDRKADQDVLAQTDDKTPIAICKPKDGKLWPNVVLTR